MHMHNHTRTHLHTQGGKSIIQRLPYLLLLARARSPDYQVFVFLLCTSCLGQKKGITYLWEAIKVLLPEAAKAKIFFFLNTLKSANYLSHRNLFVTTIMDKIFEKNSSFLVKQRTMGKVQFLLFWSFLLALTKLSFLKEDWALGYNSMKFCDFPDIF